MNDAIASAESEPRPRRRIWPALIALLLIAALAAGGWYGWQQWQGRRSAQEDQLQRQLAALDQRIDALRGDARAQSERIQDAAATNRVLRDEMLGLSQRGALLEDTVAKLADSTRQGAAALRLDQTELELHLAAQRLTIAGDLPGAQQAYALAADTLAGLDDPRVLNLKQSLEQERAAVVRLGAGPKAQALQRLDAASAALAQLPRQVPVDPATRPAWQRVLAPLVDVRPSGARVAVVPAQRAAFDNALQLELTLARAAAERHDAAGFGAAVLRAAGWVPRLWPATPQASALERQLRQIAALPLQPQIPELGSTLAQLQAQRGKATGATPWPATPPSPSAPAAQAPTEGTP
ncbi:hypothetical protein [Pseudoxanthomonas winnipegensis]|uniref:hypothetical protein n=1 Tax=Pseudoxanthomonas winnipegensis TaxID=2480810 RepID=UPI001F27AA61|nr:hypothetical protein [Pseudoxanthomonas winnipegensis]